MKRNIIVVALILYFPIQGYSQLKTYLSVEAGPAWDINRVSDPGKEFSPANIYGTICGLALWQEIVPNLSFGTGAYYHQYSCGINPKDQRPHQSSYRSYKSILLPARLAYRIQLSDLPFSLSPIMGYQYGNVIGTGILHSSSSSFSDPEGNSIDYQLNEEAPGSANLHLLELGVSAAYRFPNNWQLSLSFSHFTGLRDTKFSTLSYSINNNPPLEASYYNDGSKIQTSFNLSAPISNLWENKKVRIHRQIEKSSSRGSSIRNMRYIYFGGDLGALWRLFSYSNPAIGTRSIDEKSFFKYSNLHSGIFVGYSFSKETSIDLGLYFQKSKSHVSVMYDHETDFSMIEKAPFFLDIPLMFRYSFNIYDDKIFIVPSTGLSALTHFSAESYNNGSGNFTYNLSEETLNWTANRIVRFSYIVRAGIGIEYKLPVKFDLMAVFNVSYSHGLREIDQLQVGTSLIESPENSSITYAGNGWLASIGIKVPVLLGKDNRKCGALPMHR